MTPASAAFPSDTSPLITALARGGVEVIDEIAGEWRSLCEGGRYDEPFYRPELIRAYVSAFAPAAQLIIATVRRGGRLIAVLPLLKERGALGGMPARKLRSPGNAHTCRYDLVHDASNPPEIAQGLWTALLGEPGWDVLELENLVAGGAAEALAEHARGAGYPTHVAPALTPPYLDLRDVDGRFDRVIERVHAKFRANLRRRMRKLEERGTLVLRRTREVDASLARFYELEQTGWKGTAGSAIGCDGPTRMFYDEVALAAAHHGYLALYTLESAGVPIAMFYGLYLRNRFYLLKTAYDEGLREFSPGQLLTHEVLRDLVARGCTEFDFLGGQMPWKADWAPALRHLNDVHIFRGAAGRALHALRFRLRPAVARAVRGVRGRGAQNP